MNKISNYLKKLDFETKVKAGLYDPFNLDSISINIITLYLIVKFVLFFILSCFIWATLE